MEFQLDEFDQIFDNTPAATAAPMDGSAPDEFDAIFDATPATPSGLNAASGEIGKGLTFGWFDEIQGVERGLQNLIAGVFGRGNGQSFGENYTNTVGALRQRDAAYEEANPLTSIGLQLGGAALPALVSGGASLAGLTTRGAAQAPGIVGAATRVLGRNLYGTGITGAPSAFQLMKMGALGGGLAGAGEANDGSRIMGAAIGAPIGAIAAPILGKAIEGGINVVGDLAANNNLIPSLVSQRGSFSGKPAIPATKLTPEEFVLARNLRNTPISDVIAGANEIEQTVASNVPLFLPEALRSPKVQRNARFIANYDPSVEFSQKAIAARAEGAGGRIKGLLGEFAPETDSTTAGVDLMNASKRAVEELKMARRDATSATYKALEGGAVPDEIAINLMDDAVINDAIETIAKKPAYKKELANAAPESFRYLNLVKQHLDDQVTSLRRAGSDNEARIVAESRQKVIDALDGLESYKEVNAKYRQMSGPINELEGTADERGLLEGILSKDRIRAHEAPSELMKLTADQIRQAKTALGPEGEAALKKSARAMLEDVMSKANEKNQPALLLLKNEDAQGKFRALLGDDDYAKLTKGLGFEKRMAEGKNTYGAGSTTAGNLEEGSRFAKDVGFWRKLGNKDWFGAVSDFFDGQIPDEVAQGLSRIYFDPKKGSQAIQNILPLLKKYQNTRGVSGAVAKGVGLGTSREVAPPGPRPRESTDLNRLIEKVVIGGESVDMPINSVVSQLEGGQQLKAYPPPAKGSGVTVATGIDLGQRSAAELKSLGVDEALAKKLDPYLGLKDADAKAALKRSPLKLTEAEATQLDDLIGGEIRKQVTSKFESATGTKFSALPDEARTVVESLAHNFGPNLDEALPTAWKHIVNEDWEALQSFLRETKWKQPELKGRRNTEAAMLDDLIKKVLV